MSFPYRLDSVQPRVVIVVSYCLVYTSTVLQVLNGDHIGYGIVACKLLENYNVLRRSRHGVQWGGGDMCICVMCVGVGVCR